MIKKTFVLYPIYSIGSDKVDQYLKQQKQKYFTDTQFYGEVVMWGVRDIQIPNITIVQFESPVERVQSVGYMIGSIRHSNYDITRVL